LPDTTMGSGAHSAHDLLNDPKLSKEAAIFPEYEQSSKDTVDESQTFSEKANDENDRTDHPRLSAGWKRTNVSRSAKTTVEAAEIDEEPEKKREEKKLRNEEISRIRSEILTLKQRGQGSVVAMSMEDNSVCDADLLSESAKRRLVHLEKKKNTDSARKRKDALVKLQDFTKRLRTIPPTSDAEKPPPPETAFPNLDEEVDESDSSWLAGSGLKFAVDSARAYEIDAGKDALEIFDPLRGKDTSEADRRLRRERAKPSLRREGPMAKW